MSKLTTTPVKAVELDGDWYVVPNEIYKQFIEASEIEEDIESGYFDSIYGHYRTGGDLNLVQLYILEDLNLPEP